MSAVMLSRVIGYVREAYIAYAFGAGPRPTPTSPLSPADWLNYIVAGGAATITFISIYTRFLAANEKPTRRKPFPSSSR